MIAWVLDSHCEASILVQEGNLEVQPAEDMANTEVGPAVTAEAAVVVDSHSFCLKQLHFPLLFVPPVGPEGLELV